MKARLSGCVKLVAGIVGIVIGKVAVQSYFDHQRETAFDRALVETSSQLNAKLPMQVDKYTRLDSTSPGPGKRFTYLYTVSGVLFKGVNVEGLIKALRPTVVNSYKTSPQLASFRDHGVEMHYVYRDTAGNYLGEIAVSAQDLR